MTRRIARFALAAAALAAFAAPASASTVPEECTGTSHRCVALISDSLCARYGICV